MNYRTSGARVRHAMCRFILKATLFESPNLYGFVGMRATCATYSIKLFNKYITTPVSHGVIGVASLNHLKKLRNLAAQVTQITKHQGDI